MSKETTALLGSAAAAGWIFDGRAYEVAVFGPASSWLD